MTEKAELSRRYDAAVAAGVEAQAMGQFGLALSHFEESLQHAQALAHPRRVHAAHLNVSSCWLSLGEWEPAKAGLAAIVLETDSPHFRSAAAVQLAEALMKEGRLEKAGHYLKLGADAARLAGDAGREVSALTMQGHLAVMEGRHPEAVDNYRAAIVRRDEMPDEALIDRGVLLDKLGYAQLLVGDLAPGLWTLRRSLAVSRRKRNAWGMAEAHVDIAFGLLLAQRNRAAERHALAALALAIQNGYHAIRKSGTYVLMEVALRECRERDFERWFDDLQGLMPDVKLSRDFFRIFDISDVISLKEL